MAVAGSNSRAIAIGAPPQGASWTALILVALALLGTFSIVGHSLDASKVAAERADLNPTRLENRFAVQQASTQTTSVVGFLMLGVVGGVCWCLAPRRRVTLNYGLLFCAIGYLGWCFTSILWSIEPQLSVRKEGILGLMLILAVGLASKFEFEDLLWIFLLVLTAFVSIGILAELRHGTLRPWRSDYRFSGTCDPNDQGLQCALLVLAALLTRFPGRDRPWLRAALMTMGLCGLWLTKSRTTLAAFVVAAALALVLRLQGPRRWVALGALFVALCLGGMAYSFISVAALGETARVASMGRQDDVSTLTGRLPLWEEAWKAALERPWLGHGYGAYWNSKHVLLYSDMFSWQIPHAHNTYIDQVLALGGIGLTLYVLWVLASAAVAWVRYERSGRWVELFVMCLMILTLVHGAAESKIPGAGIGSVMQLTFMAALILRAPLPRVAIVSVLHARGPLRRRATPWQREPSRGHFNRRGRIPAIPPA